MSIISGQCVWKWTMDDLSHRMLMTYSDTELMVYKIHRLSGESQNLVKLAAAIGHEFSVLTLAGVMGSLVPTLYLSILFVYFGFHLT